MDILRETEDQVIIQTEEGLEVEHLVVTDAIGEIQMEGPISGTLAVPYGAVVSVKYKGGNSDTLHVRDTPERIRKAAAQRFGVRTGV